MKLVFKACHLLVDGVVRDQDAPDLTLPNGVRLRAVAAAKGLRKDRYRVPAGVYEAEEVSDPFGLGRWVVIRGTKVGNHLGALLMWRDDSWGDLMIEVLDDRGERVTTIDTPLEMEPTPEPTFCGLCHWPLYAGQPACYKDFAAGREYYCSPDCIGRIEKGEPNNLPQVVS